MKTLIVHAHPDPLSYGAALGQGYAAALRGATPAGRGLIREIVLAEAEFDPVLRFGYRERMPHDELVARSQDALEWADHLVLVTPIWWASFPALLHGWFERVLAPGFAYQMRGISSEQLMRGKTATLVATSYGPGFYTRLIPNSPARLLRAHILGICGIRLRRTLLLGSMNTARDTPERRARFLARVRAAAERQAEGGGARRRVAG